MNRTLRLVAGIESVLGLAHVAMASAIPLTEVVAARLTPDRLDYDSIYSGTTDWRLLAPIDHPEPARCLVSGTGLTHVGSAASRDAMHGKSDAEMTDSMRMFRWGLEGGRPEPGRCGTAPEWFYKGNGTAICARASRSWCPAMLKTVARKPKLPAST